MTNNLLNDAINLVDDDLISEAYSVQNSQKSLSVCKCMAIAAAFAIILTAVVLGVKGTNKPFVESATNPNTSSVVQKNDKEVITENTAATQIKENITGEKSNNDIGGGEILPRKYRNNYYSIPASFVNIVGKKDFEEWENIYLAENYPDDSNEMVMLAYVKEFNISKEDFEKANLKYAYFIDEVYSHICLDPQDYADQEFQEIYNTEIIYTFDNDLINEYYLGIDYPFLNEYQYVEAVESGTYETRTTEFIDIEQMEAEIISKYGETEIVTETTTAIPEETEITE